MASISKRLRRIEEPRMLAACLAVPLVVILAAYAYALTISPPTLTGVASAAALVGIAGTGLLYAWRGVTGASDE